MWKLGEKIDNVESTQEEEMIQFNDSVINETV